MKIARRLSSNLSNVSSIHRDEDLYHVLLDSLKEYAVIAISADGIVLNWNSGAEQTFGYARNEIVGLSFKLIFTAQDIRLREPQAELDRAVKDGIVQRDRWHMRKNGSRFWGTNTVQPLYGRSGTLLGFTKLVRDTTASYLANEKLGDSEQQLRLLVESVQDYAIFSLELDGTITSWSAGAENVFHYEAIEITGQNIAVLYNATDVAAGVPSADLRDALTYESVDVTEWLIRKDRTTFLAAGKINKLRTNATGESRGFVIIVHDTTDNHHAVEEMRRQANFDALTELMNRRTFYEHVTRAISLVKRRSFNLFAVLFIDLDNFKAVNDEFGHITADKVLASIARRLETSARSEDVVARVGGDEFAILLSGIDGVVDASDAAQRILVEMQQAVKTDAGDIFAAVSIGIAIGTAKYDLPTDILRDADAAMYVAKSRGRARAVVFDEAIQKSAQENLDLTTELRHAIERDELRIAYQPVLNLQNMDTVGFEALVRWKHPRRGLLHPGEFIPKAEDSNLVVAVDRWVLSKACWQLANWQNRRIVNSDLQMSVNISSKEFSRDDFLQDLRGIVAANSVDVKNLRLEITESTVLERSPRAYQILAAVRALGINVDVDDFGTGYASLGALNHIVVDGLKVDSSFLRSTDAHHGWEIVEAVITLAHKLGLVAIAEGIETSDQLRRLIALGCDFGQGYLFAPALGPVAAAAFLREKASKLAFAQPTSSNDASIKFARVPMK